MGRSIEIIDPETERRNSRRRKILFLAVIMSFALFGYPEAKHYSTKWEAMSAARKLGLYLITLKTQAILKKTPFEARFVRPDRIEVYDATSCTFNAQRTKLWEIKLSDFGPNIEFVAEQWVRENNESHEPYLVRYCYDPLYGSSLLADGLAHGTIFLAHNHDIRTNQGEQLAQLLVEGGSGNIQLE